MALRTLETPASLEALFARDRAVHAYGLADLEEPFWSAARWWQDGDAAVGALALPGAASGVVYAISEAAPEATLDLLARLRPQLPDHFVITGPPGSADVLSHGFGVVWMKPYVKMQLTRPDALPPPDARVLALGRDDLGALAELYAADADAGDFFLPYMLDSGFYRGRHEEGLLVAAAGVHVISRTYDVAAIGNVATLPAARRRGHARAVVATLCHDLRATVSTVALNVAVPNVGARALYGRLGFDQVHRYEEAELRRPIDRGTARSHRPPGSVHGSPIPRTP